MTILLGSRIIDSRCGREPVIQRLSLLQIPQFAFKGFAMLRLGKRLVAQLLVAFVLISAPIVTAIAQESEPATRQFAVAVGFQNQKLYEAAIDEWQTFITKFPKDPRIGKATHYLGTCQLQAKQYPAAVATFESVIQKHPKFEMLEQSMLNLGAALFSLAQESKKPEDYDRSEQVFARLTKEFPKGEFASRALYYRGECLFQQNKLPEAAAAYSELVNSFPSEELLPDAYYALGICQEAMKKTDEARATFAAFQSKFSKHPLATEVRMREAEILFSSGQFDQAQSQFALVSAVKEFPLADTAMLRQARCLYELGKYEEAGSLYWSVPRQFANTKHYDTAVLAGAKCFYLAGKYAQARSGLENVAGRNVPEAAEASQWIARSLLKEQNPEKALSILDQAIAKHATDPAFPQLVLARVDALYELPNRRAETVILYADFARNYPNEELASQAQYMSALTALDLGDHAAAKANSDAFIQQFPNDRLLADVEFIGAEARLLLRDYSGAEKLYRDFLKLAPSHSSAAQARVRLGLALLLANQPAESLRELESALSELRDPDLRSEALAIMGRNHVALEQMDKAAAQFEESLKANPNRDQSDQTLLSLADVYRRLNRSIDADTRLEQLRKEFPQSPLMEEATFRLGESAYAQEKFDQAIAQYGNVVSSWPEGTFAPHAQYGLGWTWFKRNEFAKSDEAMTTLATRFPKSELATKGLYVRAMARFQQSQHAAAAEDVTAFLKSNPPKKDALDAQYLLGLAHAGQRQFAEAANTYAAILTSDAQYSDADKVLYELAWAYLELGRQGDSIAAFRRLATDFPNSPLAVESLFRVGESLYDGENYAEAANAFAATQSKAGTAEMGEKAAHKRAWSYFKAESLSEAAIAFESQLKDYPAGPLAGDAEFLLGECLYKQKQWAAAAAHYASVIAAKHPTYQALAIYRSGECAAALEQWDDSLKFHQQVLNGFPEFELRPEARYGIGWALQQQQKLAEAIPYYEAVTEETDTETAAKARFMIGECYFAQKNHKDATKHFLKAAFAYGHKEWSAMAWFEAARCFEVLRDVAQAKNCYQQMIEKFPDHPKVEDARKRLADL